MAIKKTTNSEAKDTDAKKADADKKPASATPLKKGRIKPLRPTS